MKHTVRTVTDWAKGDRPSVAITVYPNRHGRTAVASWTVMVQFFVWALPALIATAQIGNVLIAFAVAGPSFAVLSRVIYVGPAAVAEPEPADIPA